MPTAAVRSRKMWMTARGLEIHEPARVGYYQPTMVQTASRIKDEPEKVQDLIIEPETRKEIYLA